MPAARYRLFFALPPTVGVRAAIAAAAEAARASGAVRGRWVRALKYHLTLHFLGGHATRPEQAIDQALAAAGQLREPAFILDFDRIDSFKASARGPCILRCSPECEVPLRTLRGALGEGLAAKNLGELLEQRFAPHVTIAYGQVADGVPLRIEPIDWKVEEFALLLSGPAAGYETLGVWPLVSEQRESAQGQAERSAQSEAGAGGRNLPQDAD